MYSLPVNRVEAVEFHIVVIACSTTVPGAMKPGKFSWLIRTTVSPNADTTRHVLPGGMRAHTIDNG